MQMKLLEFLLVYKGGGELPEGGPTQVYSERRGHSGHTQYSCDNRVDSSPIYFCDPHIMLCIK